MNKGNNEYPRVLIVALGRINASDNSNNGLLVRNLFGAWPKGCLAQVFSGGENGDAGFFGSYYQLSSKDRHFGRFYYQYKANNRRESERAAKPSTGVGRASLMTYFRQLGNRFFMSTGLYELIFSVRLSSQLRAFVDEFAPEMIFVQGYSLSFTRLSLLLAKYKRIPIVYYPTDDWSNARYNPKSSPLPVLSWVAHQFVLSNTRRLVTLAAVPIAFNSFMRDVYRERYGKEFSVLMHGDDAERYRRIKPRRTVRPDQLLIVCTGDFDTYRWELLKDMDDACKMLEEQGYKPCVMAYPVNYSPKLEAEAECLRYVRLAPCPAHDELAAVLRGADILFLPERFGPAVWDIRLSISSKAHLFMFSGVPIIVYSDATTGIARYAREYKWAKVVDQRDTGELSRVVAELASNPGQRRMLEEEMRCTIKRNHDLTRIRQQFLKMVRDGLKSS